MTKHRQADIVAARDRLRELFPAGSIVTVDLAHVSRSGVTRDIRVIAVVSGSALNVSRLVSVATGDRMSPASEAIRVGGCGMDMGFALVYGLARVLYREGFACIGERCPANDHVNERERDYTPGRTHSDPGYALRHRWL